MDTKAAKEFWIKRSKKKQFRWVDHLSQNHDLVLDNQGPGNRILSIGAGDGKTETGLTRDGFRVTAVDILPKPNCVVEKWVQDSVENMSVSGRFGTVIMFGVAHFINESDLLLAHMKINKLMTPDGVFLMKHQSVISGNSFTVDTDVDGDRYLATYRTIYEEIRILELMFGEVSCQRAYPDMEPRHKNTDFMLYKAWKPKL